MLQCLAFFNIAVCPGNVSAVFFTLKVHCTIQGRQFSLAVRCVCTLKSQSSHHKYHVIDIYGICMYVGLILISEQIILHVIADIIFPFGASPVCSAAAGKLRSGALS